MQRLKGTMQRRAGLFSMYLAAIGLCVLLLSACSSSVASTPNLVGQVMTEPTATSTPTMTVQTSSFSGVSQSSVPDNTNSTSGAGQNSATDQVALVVFQAINQSRAAAGLPALKWDQALQRSAHQHNLAMADAQEMSHQLPGEADLGTRETQQGVQWSWAGENIGYTSSLNASGALGLHQAMMNEQPPDDGHRQNILTSGGNALGVDILFDFQHHLLWLTEDFAQV